MEIEKPGVRPLKIILFGFYAGGIPREGSDIDVIVISDDFKNKTELIFKKLPFPGFENFFFHRTLKHYAIYAGFVGRI